MVDSASTSILQNKLAFSQADRDIMLQHYRLGHPNFVYLEKMFPKLFINKDTNLFQCDVCQLSKHTRSTYTPKQYVPSKPFSIIHSDIWGPSRVKNLNGARWFLTLIDDHTRISWVYLMKDKSEASSIIIQFHKMIKNQFTTDIQIIHSDNAKDYFNA